MLEIMLVIWIIAALPIVFERRMYRIVIYFAIFSLITSVCFLLLGAPDVAMAEAAVAVFTTIFFVVCLERHYGRRGNKADEVRAPARGGKWGRYARLAAALVFAAGLCVLFIHLAPTGPASTYLKDLYLLNFMADVGGQNAAAAIYLGYRVYDTLFEALILVIAVVAVSHMSWLDKATVDDGRHSEIENSSMAIFTMRIVSPIILLFGVYLMFNGHITAGGGFQGGVAVATFFICRYMVYGIYDIPVKRVIKLEEYIFIFIILIAVVVVFVGYERFLTDRDIYGFQNAYLLTMNILIGVKVACGFFLIFYRYVAIERKDDKD